MRFEKIYMQSGTNKKADNTDYVDYYLADNGMVIQVVELLNSRDRLYKVFDSETDMKRKPNPFRLGVHWCFQTLKDAKNFVAQIEV